MTSEQTTRGSLRILVVRGHSVSDTTNRIPATDIAKELQGVPGIEVQTLSNPAQADIASALSSFQPNILYLWAGCSGTPDAASSKLHQLMLTDGASTAPLTPDAMLSLVQGRDLQALMLNVHPESLPLTQLKPHVKHIVHWVDGHQVPAINAAVFAQTAFGLLRQPSISFTEAFAVAVHLLRAHGCGEVSAKRDPVFPVLLSDEPPELPGTKPMPIPSIDGVDLSMGFSRSVPGWDTTRLLSPVAEVTLQLLALPSILDTERLAALGLALRAFCTLEVRGLRVIAAEPVDYTPSHIVPGSDVARVRVATQSGVQLSVVIGAPTQVMKTPGLLAAALRATLTCDAVSLRFQLPPHGSQAPEAQASPAVAGGTKTTPALLITSVWVVTLLRTLAADAASHYLAMLGIGQVGSRPVAGVAEDDVRRYQLMQSQQPLLLQIPQLTYTRLNMIGGPPPPAWDMNQELPAGRKGEKGKTKVDRGATLRETKFDDLTRNAGDVEQWKSARPPLHLCTQHQFMEDLMDFLKERWGWSIDRNEFPGAVLNGSPLDLYNLYKEVVSRGGFKMGNAINWKGLVFPKMSNWTATHKMTGVGNALKRHYQRMLWEYERANQRDVAGDRCMLCHGGAEGGADWLACGSCDRWQHFACDPRRTLGSFKELAESGKAFQCVDCEKSVKSAAT